jgi:hypothetical protein
MLTEETVVASIVVHEKGHIVVNREARILRDGVVIAAEKSAHEYAPGDDLSGEDAPVVGLAQVIWTQEVLQAHKDFLEAHLAKLDAAAEARQLEGTAQQ